MNKHITKIGLIFLFCSFVYGGAANTERLIKESVKRYFEQKFETTAQDMRINFIRLPQRLPQSSDHKQVQVYSQHSTKKLGYQTVWVKLVSASKVLKKFPVSVDVSLNKEVFVAGRKIKFHRKISADMLRKEKRFIRAGLDKLVNNIRQIEGMEAKQVIAAGTVITADQLRQPPLVRRNQKVTIKFQSGALSIRTDGIARGEGTEGELISVRCTSTGKLFKARILGAGQVLVEKEYAL